MNLEKLGQWVGIVANVGVFAGFLLVAYQLHQNTVGLQSTSVSNSSQLFASADLSMMGDTTYAAFAHALTDPASMSPEELAQMWAYFSVSLFSANVAYDDYRQGIISEDRWLGIRDTFVSYINHPVGRIIWAAQADSFAESANRDFFETVQARLDASPPDVTQAWFLEMLAQLRALPTRAAPSAPRAAGREWPPIER